MSSNIFSTVYVLQKIEDLLQVQRFAIEFVFSLFSLFLLLSLISASPERKQIKAIESNVWKINWNEREKEERRRERKRKRGKVLSSLSHDLEHFLLLFNRLSSIVRSQT